ncbi:hypothetical protein L6250_03045 [Candidatus Parcubacteria bacterium]|nr:hypothetical protein [Candidatus Parcubacteria bacterium]
MKLETITIEEFDGQMLHPSLDIKNGVLTLGFCYRTKPREEKDIFVIVNDGNMQIVTSDSFTVKEQSYFFEKRARKLSRLEEKWAVSALQQLINDNKVLKPNIAAKIIFEKFVSLAKRYIELEKEIDYYLLVAWIIGTYFFPLFYTYPFLHIKAPKRSGKSQLLNFLLQLCFNAIKARPSLAALGDTVDSLRGTYLIDQADVLRRKGSEDLSDILADSYKQNGGKRRIIDFNKKRGREILELETYSPKAFASIKELPEDLRDRCLMVPLIRSQKNFPDPDDSNENWRELRGELYQLLMASYDFVDSTYVTKKIGYRKNQEILGRDLELWLPFEVILECSGMDEKIVEAKKRFLSQYGFSEYEPSELEEEVVKTILNQFKDGVNVILTPKEISELINVEEVFYTGDSLKQKAAKVGWAIKKLNLPSEKKPRSKEGVRYLFEKNKVENIYRSYFKNGAEPTPPTPTGSDGLNAKQMTVQDFDVGF